MAAEAAAEAAAAAGCNQTGAQAQVCAQTPPGETAGQTKGGAKRPVGGAHAAASWSKERASTNQLLRQQACRDPRLAPFKCQLDNLDLWHRFHPLDTEMIITKQGR